RSARRDQASRTQRTSVPKFGGLPNIRRPMRKTLDANHTAPTTPNTPIAIDSHTCHTGGGCVDASRSNMPNEFTGGKKLTTTDSVESGSREIGIHKNHGTMSSSVIGNINDCASRRSFTAEPIAIISEPIVKNASKKNTSRYGISAKFSKPNSENDVSTARPIAMNSRI